MAEIKDITIRKLRRDDLKALVEIDKKVLDRLRPQYWQIKIELLESTTPISPLVAELDGKVVGFILASASGWEFGVPDTVGWIDTIGVDPAHQHKGIARALYKEMIKYLKKVGVTRLYTLVSWRDGDLLKFFNKIGFDRGDLINLELKLDN